ncbi:unnamed protein product [Diabrotica balteata]|uniref:Ubiquitin-associated protein 1 n=1 Tax=Diabrotica balteata TaxID=107213 RepID=A0A9N9XER1_DIABA|nr:unnamed protein product [Diabrotica balteata]
MSKQSHDCYTDNIKVKISEKYKPPPRINLAISYAQRLSLNKQIQDNMPNYEFSLEKTVLSKMKEWKEYRSGIVQERKDKIEKAREEINEKMKKEQEEKEQADEVELKTVNETGTKACTSTTATYITGTNITNINQNYGSYSVNNDILVPTQINNQYSNILTPIPLQSYGTQQYTNPNDKSPFNLSDFENDTSSPFDNMELKSINDMEELAQVLNRDKNSSYKISSNSHTYSNFSSVRPAAQVQPTFSNYMSNQYSYNIPSTASYVQPVVTDYSRTNGYYYDNSPFQNQYVYKPSPPEYFTTPSSQPSATALESNKPNCKSVPDIMKALETEIENTHITASVPKESYIRNELITQTTRPKSTDAVYPRPKIKKDDLDDPLHLLPKNQQDFCRSISSMGFPLSRVVRTCQILGDDQKKVVDHLLALTDLLDLGFAEKDISDALVQCDNDKDKALDKLIS